ncbi:hypothetical protein BKY56_018065 [Klebsiella pneumoniae]|nr:hypothetical protein BKY56_018065 [Klebsiella pneumoniae]
MKPKRTGADAVASDKKSTSQVSSTLSTGGIGIILSGLVTYFVPESKSGLAKLLYLFIPFVSAILTYLMAWVIARHGLESPEDAAKRANCLRDLATIDAELANSNNSDEFKKKLRKSREKTVEMMINIGKESTFNLFDKNSDQTAKGSD